MPRRVALLFALICANAAPERAMSAPPEKASEHVTLTVVPATTSLYVGDSLIIKGIIQNRGKEAVVLSKPFEASWGGVRCEVCPPNATVFNRAYAVSEGENCWGRKTTMGAGASDVCYERLFRGAEGGGPIFSAAGKWRLRIAVTIGDEVITSEPVTLKIVAPSKRLQKALDGYYNIVENNLYSWMIVDKDINLMAEAEDRLMGSNAGQVITQARVLRDLQLAKATKARQFAMEAVAKHRTTLNPVAREEFDLFTAKLLCERKEYKDAKRLLDPISEKSRARDWLRAEVDYYLVTESK